MRNVLALAVASAVLFVELWTVVPAPNIVLLAFAVVVPEIAPWGIVACALATVVISLWASGRARLIALTFCAGAVVCAALPLLQLPEAIARGDAQMGHVLGPAYARGPRFDLLRCFTGGRAEAPVRVERDLPFVTRDGVRLGLDLYRAPGAWAHPAVVVIFGGGWRIGARDNYANDDRRLAALGYSVVAIDYRLVPRHRFPTQLYDVQDALAAVARNARAWGIDPKRVALLGRSAGGELALLAAYHREPVTVRAVVGFYPPVDLADGYREPPDPDPANVRAMVSDYLGGTPDALPAAYSAASPLDIVRDGLPPTLLIGGARDELVLLRFQRRLRDALASHGDAVVSLELPWSNHSFDAIPDGLGGQLTHNYVEQFLAATL